MKLLMSLGWVLACGMADPNQVRRGVDGTCDRSRQECTGAEALLKTDWCGKYFAPGSRAAIV